MLVVQGKTGRNVAMEQITASGIDVEAEQACQQKCLSQGQTGD